VSSASAAPFRLQPIPEAVVAQDKDASEDLPLPTDATVASPGSGDAEQEASAPGATHGRFLPGTLFGKRYRIVGLLGKGGMGEVYRADDLSLDQGVALKLLPSSLAHDPTALSRLRSEVRLARQVSHPNVCRVYDLGEVDGESFVAMEYVDGEDLASVLRRLGRPAKEKALEIARQICAGLAAAHDSGVIHRDLKPANIMVDGRGRARITDFGLAGEAQVLGRADARSGTPLYMAPEQLAGREVTRASDIYSLGLVLYELFSGRRAFDAGSVPELLEKMESTTPSSLSSQVEGLDPAVERVVRRCLEADPRRRPLSALAVAAALPGGDPLAAALAAGETPSPEMVAAAGGRGGLPLPLAVGSLLAVLLGFLVVARLNNAADLVRLAPPPLPPPVLAHQARTLLADLGYREEPADRDYGFHFDHGLLDRIEKSDSTAGRWGRLGRERPAPIIFQYRESPLTLVPGNIGASIRPHDPPRIWGGMASLELDGIGRLLSLEVVPPERDDGTPPLVPTDFAALFAAAELDTIDFAPAVPLWTPPVATDERRAWLGHYPGRPEQAVRADAGAFRGRPVFFLVADPAREPERTAGPAQPQSGADRLVEYLGLAIGLAAVLLAILFARYNLRRGRGDRRGAYRFGLFVLILMLLAWVLGADLPGNPVQSFNIFLSRGLALALVIGGLAGLGYLGMEPYVRHHWPQILISWTRLMTGRLQDELVGRDVLLGALAGVTAVILDQLQIVVPRALGLLSGPPLTPDPSGLVGGRTALADFFSPQFLIQPLTILFLVMVMLWLCRGRRRLAVAVTYLLILLMNGGLGLLQTAGAPEVSAQLAAGLETALVLFVLIRWGFLSLVAGLFFAQNLTSFLITLDTTAWYASTSLLVLLALGALAAYACRIAIRRRTVAGA
jgi:predicted Ser/Thr protein kinase